MTGSTLPGRPGNLTAEEEIKLRELWILSAKLFGAIEPTPSQPAPTEDTSEPSQPASTSSRKSRFGLFRRHKEETAPPSQPSAFHSTVTDLEHSGSAGNDKHGQGALFKEAMANSSPEELRDAFWQMVKHDHPDALLLRFLRARKWDVHAAMVMAISALHWRLSDSKVDSEIIYKGEMGMLDAAQSTDAAEKKLGSDFMEQIRLGKSFIRGVDKEGRPCCYVRVRLHHAGDQSEESLERFTVYTIETARLMLKPSVDTASIIFDMTDFGLSNMDYAPVKFMIKCFEANYPESLGAVLVHKAPWVFQGIWKVIRGWLDPVVASKVHFTNNLNDLSEFINQDNIIKELGGPDKYSYEYIEPVPGENEGMKDVAKKTELETARRSLATEYEDTIKQWATLQESDKEGFDKSRAKRDEIAGKLFTNYWAIDPLVRARSLYDRNGELSGVTHQSGVIKPEAARASSISEGTQAKDSAIAQSADEKTGAVIGTPAVDPAVKVDA
ncbi:CRAL/TRIO domain-containing protein [Microthyrium microscopicum]|uniref:CRAL/TRIO domain-containing protein n=1 Tax=Microthyrium microscopicum TaxID=703497 RepID=A0A6A6U4G2_9PEZI|nr:CRAL/TRIO domain-containing protein [Microthyrium microscopicum]